MTARELRLRARIDVLRDQRDHLDAENRILRVRLARAIVNPLVAREVLVVPHSNQHGPCPVYGSVAERREARRLSWRLSQRRRQARSGKQGQSPALLGATTSPDRKEV